MKEVNSISRHTLTKMTVRIAIVTLIVTAVSYVHLMKNTEGQVKENLTQFISERSNREKISFQQANENHTIITAEFLSHYQKQLISPDLDRRFESLTIKNASGVIRNRDARFDGRKDTGIFIAKRPLNREFKARILAAYDVTNRFGLPYHHQFQDLYFTFPENAIVLYWPESPNWVMNAKDDFNLTTEEYHAIATPENNPKRKTVWTGLFYDSVSSIWMVTASTPIYIGDKFIGVIHHDLMVNEIIDRTIKERLSGASGYYIIRTDGRLILHPSHNDEIKNHAGNFNMQATNDADLKAQFKIVQEVTSGVKIVDSPDGKENIAIAKIDGPDWYLVTTYPYSSIRSTSAKNSLFVLFAGLFSLLVEISVLFFVLRDQISTPLHKLIEATRKITEQQTFVKIELNRSDELGELADSFNEMTRTIRDRDEQLAQYTQNLELLVSQRTRELDEQKAINLQASKMSSLGEMAGGIAHEINTPLAIIKILVSQAVKEVQTDIPDLDNLTSQLQRIETTTDRVAKIVKSLRTFARDGGSDPFEMCNLGDIVNETVILCAEQLRVHNVELSIDMPSDIPLNCRSSQLGQVLLNLINNASDAIENLQEKWIKIQSSATSNGVEIRISDSGRGIPKDVQDKMFQPFYTTKGVGKGTGIGLSISLGIIKSHKGQIFIDNKSPHTCFVIQIPTHPAKAAA